MKSIKSMLLLCVLAVALNGYAQKGKVNSAEISLSEGKVLDAKKDIDAALTDAETQNSVKAWRVKGDVYKDIYETKLYYPQNPNCLFDAKDAYIKALGLETNPKKQKDYSTPLSALEGYLFNEGLSRYKQNNNEDAFRHFSTAYSINELLLSKGLQKSIDTSALFAAAVSGASAKKYTEVTPMLEKLVSMNYNEPSVYESLAQIYEETKNTEALAEVVKKGLDKFPDNKNLKVLELNQALSSNDLSAQIQKFEDAVKKEPKNTSYMFNLAVIYDKAGQVDKAKATYEQIIAADTKFGDAYYNLGIMTFNEGIELNKKMNALDDKEVDKYNALKKQRDEIFQKALPYLEKAYQIDTKNPDYKQSLRKVYAAMNMLDKAKALD
ncbi:MAG TPA: tetratricopeptide repeat protein [Chitinophagales bacterium]|nr:tetratricopeptide repeat protein [Chitinophagales bacterium]